ncbi:MAG: DUF1553 domain-containing protein [Planctomycetaceae bacterium]
MIVPAARRAVARAVSPRMLVGAGMLMSFGTMARIAASPPDVDPPDWFERQPIETNEVAYLFRVSGLARGTADQIQAAPPELGYAEVAEHLPPEQRSEYRRIVRELTELELRDALLAGGPLDAVVPLEEIPPTRVLKGGQPDRPGELVSPRGLSCVSIPSSDFGLSPDAEDADRRIRLARWITDPNNPLFARVMVNRVWHHHWGRGLTETPNDFGFNGRAPTHPELLDWLAATFATDDSWRLKALHRRIVTSATYRQAAAHRPDATLRDPDNQLLWRWSPRRKDAETVRDSIAAVSGQDPADRRSRLS